MRRGLMIAMAVTLLCGLTTSPGLAQSACGGASKAKATACGKTPGTDTFPTMSFMVGEKTYKSHKAAEKAAKDRDGKVVFAVRDEKFDTMPEAMKTLACASECYAEKFTSIGGIVDGKLLYCSQSSACGSAKKASCSAKTKGASSGSSGTKTGTKTRSHKAVASACGKNCSCQKCAKSGAKTRSGKASDKASGKTGGKACGKNCSCTGCAKSRAKSAKKGACSEGACPRDKATKFVVAGTPFDKYDDAVKARDQVRKAAGAVKLSYLVNGQKVDCETKVCPSAKAAGQVKFVVASQETPCEEHARVLMSKARVAAATKALESKKDATARL